MKSPARKKKVPSFATRVIGGLRELSDALDRGEAMDRRFTVRKVTISDPGLYSAARVRQTRHRLAMSQALFAKVIGVSVKLVEHWERGVRVPSRPVRRILDEMNAHPDYWRDKLRAA